MEFVIAISAIVFFIIGIYINKKSLRKPIDTSQKNQSTKNQRFRNHISRI